VIPNFEEKSLSSIEVAFPYIQGFSLMFHNNFVASNDVTCQPKTLAGVGGEKTCALIFLPKMYIFVDGYLDPIRALMVEKT